MHVFDDGRVIESGPPAQIFDDATARGHAQAALGARRRRELVERAALRPKGGNDEESKSRFDRSCGPESPERGRRSSRSNTRVSGWPGQPAAARLSPWPRAITLARERLGLRDLTLIRSRSNGFRCPGNALQGPGCEIRRRVASEQMQSMRPLRRDHIAARMVATPSTELTGSAIEFARRRPLSSLLDPGILDGVFFAVGDEVPGDLLDDDLEEGVLERITARS